MSPEFLLPDPPYLGLPEKFTHWRAGQDRAALRAMGSDKRFVALSCPTGFGKTVAYIAAALLSGQRVCILTSTRGLQSQIVGDFAESGLVDIRGQNNYACVFDDGQEGIPRQLPTCEEGPCHSGVKCDLQKGGCTYYDALSVARKSPLVVTNYSFWMKHQEEKELGQFGMLVLDEAHDALEWLGEHLAVELWQREFEETPLDCVPDFDNWKAFAKAKLIQVFTRIEELSRWVRQGERRREVLVEIRTLKRLERKLAGLAGAKGDWVWQVRRQGRHAEKVARFDPVWPSEYAEKHLFGWIPHVVLTSATIRPKTLDLLGIDRSSVDFVEYPSSFPVDSRPVFWVPTVRVDKRATPAHLNAWVAKMDAIIAQRLDRKGIIHSVSFEKAQLIQRRSQYANLMLLNQSGTTQDTVAEFRRSKPPRILVSPSISTGWDFPYDQARYQIVAKLPFADSRDPVLKARTERDRNYGIYQMVQTLVQMCGRIVRSESDYGESFILDDHFEWVSSKHRNLFPKWFTQAVKKSLAIPRPMSTEL